MSKLCPKNATFFLSLARESEIKLLQRKKVREKERISNTERESETERKR